MIATADWKDVREVYTLVSKLAGLDCHPDSAMNCHPGVSQTGGFIHVCAVLRMDVKLGVPSAGISWWTSKAHSVLCEEYVSYRQHRVQILNSFPNLS